jgi:hypothetical protein
MSARIWIGQGLARGPWIQDAANFASSGQNALLDKIKVGVR